MEEDNLVTTSVGPDNNKVVRKYEVTEDGVVLVRFTYTFTHTSFFNKVRRLLKIKLTNINEYGNRYEDYALNRCSLYFQTMTHEKSGQVAKRYFKRLSKAT